MFDRAAQTALLTEPTSLDLVNQLQQTPISTPLREFPINTSYVSQGQGDSPLLLLHGFDSSVLEFRRLIPLLAQTRSTWAIDLLGFGFTERGNLAINPDTIKTHLYYSWKTLVGRPVTLVGASMGGAAALDFALTYPEAVSHLVLIGSAGMTAGPALGKFLIEPLGNLATSFLSNPKVRQSISEKAYHNSAFASVDALTCAALHLQEPGWKDALISFTRSGGYGSFRQRLAQLTLPTLILWGESDRILGTKDALTFERAIANSRLVWIPQSGHVPHLEKAAVVAQKILQFCQTL